jgi:Ion channel
MIAFIASLIQMSYCLRMFERQLAVQSGQDFGLLTNSIWNVFITMTTVGYGDIYPKTSMGRVIGIVVALWGLFLVSIFTVTLSNLFTFSTGELKAFGLGERLKMKDSLRVSAANVLGSSFKAKKTLQLYPDDKLAILSAINTHKR